jgi:hypothetical protein
MLSRFHAASMCIEPYGVAAKAERAGLAFFLARSFRLAANVRAWRRVGLVVGPLIVRQFSNGLPDRIAHFCVVPHDTFVFHEFLILRVVGEAR